MGVRTKLPPKELDKTVILTEDIFIDPPNIFTVYDDVPKYFEKGTELHVVEIAKAGIFGPYYELSNGEYDVLVGPEICKPKWLCGFLGIEKYPFKFKD